MVIKTDELKELCQKIILGIDSNELAIITSSMSIQTKNSNLYLSITNREYYMTTYIPVSSSEDFNVTVNANLFTKLISQLTTENVELSVDSGNLNVKGNGHYKIPVIFENNTMLELPEITINNIINEFDVDGNIFNSINNINSKEMNKGVITKPVQKCYYLDNKGAITFTSGACVNDFELKEDVKLLFNARLVKLFKLFKDKNVKFTIGEDKLSGNISQTKVKFTTDDVVITAILFCDDTLMRAVPVAAIRGMANQQYANNVIICKNDLLDTINRIMIFNTDKNSNVKCYGAFEFGTDGVTVHDGKGENKEVVKYFGLSNNCSSYSAKLNLIDLKTTIENCTTETVQFNFGNGRAMVLVHGNVKNIVPEVSTTLQ